MPNGNDRKILGGSLGNRPKPGPVQQNRPNIPGVGGAAEVPHAETTDPHPEAAITTGIAAGGDGVQGEGNRVGVFGCSERNVGVYARSAKSIGLVAEGNGIAAKFAGNVVVEGDISFTAAADCAEYFDIANAQSVEPGTVMVLGDDGMLSPCRVPHDKRVAGVVSGAGDYKPGIVLDKRGPEGTRLPIALLGKVFCKVDAANGPIEVGDLLTTSRIPGHAMKASDPLKAFGSVIGKALKPLPDGQGMIPILVALQ